MAEHALITGGAGFVGAHLARRLLADGVEVTLLDNLSRGRADETFDELRRHARFVEHDLTVPIPPDLIPGRVDTVYHLAAVVGVQRTTQAPLEVLRTNVLTASTMFDWCDANEPETVFLSSTSEFADGAANLGLAPFPTPEDIPFALAQPRSARSSYALSKAVAESLLLYRAHRMKVRIGRYFNVYGPRMGHSHVIPQFIDRMVKGENPFRVYGGEQSRAFCHIDDAVHATIGVTRQPSPEPLVVNIGNNDEELAITDLARRLFTLAGVSRDLEVLDPPPNSPDRRLPDLTTLNALLPDRKPVPLDTGLRQMLDWYAS